MSGLPEAVVRDIVTRALAEDVGPGDITTLATVSEEARCRGELVAREAGVIAGLAVACMTFRALDAYVSFETALCDGERIGSGQVVASLAGSTQGILTAERTALNFLQRMSGIATLTSRFVAAVAGTKARICDTRKTAPGLRVLDKYAVRMGGGWNHRSGLFDGVLIKDNHIRAAAGIADAVRGARARSHHLERIEVEAQSLEEVEEAIAAGVDIIMLDNFQLAEVARAVKLIRGRCEVEASGGITIETVRAIAECGVDYISVGELTHSARALDISLEIRDG